ncbi:4Fe-4S binding protein [Nitrogeniibacter mangrovi]|uniref:4Fe-4S binding protein n=1 Tax=Nitrogeniibacter mangrovi TaxID=2016596 RepID=A0A6C1B285_9RHOO|nr:4Fe-4S binding protein [Nitrogeniibacter mangrovi]QID17483.1 4Fe-4S binding protein [Nitrogeniibacter mangrovi]
MPSIQRLIHILVCLLTLTLALSAGAGELTRADIAKRFGPPLHVGEQPPDLPAWPISTELEPDGPPVAWVFESIDLAPIPGFEGTPFDLLITLDRDGRFMNVEVLRQHEPVFLSGLGEGPLLNFVKQYEGKSLKKNITVSTAYGDLPGNDDMRVVLDGVTKATASVRILNQTVLTAGLAVARAKLGFAPVVNTGPPATPKPDLFERKSFDQLVKEGAIGHLRLTEAQVEKLFEGTDVAGWDDYAKAHPDAVNLDLYVAYLNVPTIGRAVLGDSGYATMRKSLNTEQHVWWVGTHGRSKLVDEHFVRGTTPGNLTLLQGGAPLELRDFDLDPQQPAGAPPIDTALVLRAPPLSGLDPAGKQDFVFSIKRTRGQFRPEVVYREATLTYLPPERYFDRPPPPPPDWLLAWMDRKVELITIGVALGILTLVLARPRWMSLSARRLAIFRNAFLVFTLAYLGWFAQGQLSIVQLTGAVKTLWQGNSLASFLYDPVSLLIMAFTLVTFFVWGRGTFCGWLCPFGALQDLSTQLGRKLGIKARRLPPTLARVLDRGRYVILAALVAAAALEPTWAERGVEVEPFKTAITVGFDRAWPFVLYAVALLVASVFYYKFFCRFLCPLGAFMTLGGKLRLLKWLPRRAACGQPCQTCRHRCQYDAIEPAGAIRYDDCFQCLDCVGIYHDEQRCAPLLLMRKNPAAASRIGMTDKITS